MARKRMIDPSIWTDDGMAELTPRQQLLYIGLVSNADDEGRLKGSASAVRLLLPTIYGGVALDDVQGDLGAVLGAFRQLRAYRVEGRPYLVFLNYARWQRIDKPSASILPAPPDDSPNVPRTVDEDSPNAPGPVPPKLKEEKRREVSGEEESGGEGSVREGGVETPEGRKRPTRLPDNFPLTPERRDLSRRLRPDLDPEWHHAEFCSYWRGDGRTKADWDQTYHNSILKAKGPPRAVQDRGGGTVNVNGRAVSADAARKLDLIASLDLGERKG